MGTAKVHARQQIVKSRALRSPSVLAATLESKFSDVTPLRRQAAPRALRQ
jgi:hypothetical protein